MRKIFAAASMGLAILPLLLHGQSTETQRFQALMSSTHENSVALTGYQAMGTAVVEFFLKRDAQGQLTSAVTDFRIEYTTGQAETFTNMHIHRGAEGSPGAVVVPANFGPAVPVPVGSGAFFRAAATTDPAVLAVIGEVLSNPSGFYVNLHSQTFPGGIMRGQLERDPARVAGSKVDALAAQIEAVKSDLAAQVAAVKSDSAAQHEAVKADLSAQIAAVNAQGTTLGQLLRQLALRLGINPADLPTF